MPDATRSQPPKLLDEVRQVLRLHYDSMHTERASAEWIVQFVCFQGRRSREDLYVVARHLLRIPGPSPLALNLTDEPQQLPWLLGEPYERFYS
jgi:hypothetical protein